MTYTYLGGNSWLLDLPAADVRVLCDPWLIGDLTFWDLPQLYSGKKNVAAVGGALDPETQMRLAEEADVILLSQGWEDHAHRPTLRALPKDIPVVGSPAAAEVAASLGFKDVTPLRDGASKKITRRCRRRRRQPRSGSDRSSRDDDDDVNEGGAHEGHDDDENDNDDELRTSPPPRVTIRATAGALVGPPWSEREAGFIISEDTTTTTSTTTTAGGGMRLYYEPHCSYDVDSLTAAVSTVGGDVDVVITPVRSVDVLGFPLVNGGEAAADLLGVLGGPRVVLPLRNGELEQEGVSTAMLGSDGVTADSFAEMLSGRFPDTSVVMPEPGVTLEVEVEDTPR